MKRIADRILFIILFVFAFSINASAQTRKEIKKAIKDRDKYFYSGTIKQTVFNQTVHFQNERGEIIVTVTINGKEYNFIFDTGAPTTISEELSKELHLEKTGAFATNDGTAYTKSLDGYTINELQIGDVVFNNTGCMVNDLKDLNNVFCKRIDGIIGVNLMHECYWKIKFADSTLNFSNELQTIPATAFALNFVENFGGNPYMQMKYGDSTLYVEFDCGANTPLTISDTSAANRKLQSHPFVAGYGTTVQTLYQKLIAKQYAGIADSVKIGGITFKNQLVFLSEQRNTSLVGTSFMKNYESTIDWKQHKIYLNPLSDTIDTKYSRSFGLTFTVDSNKLKIIFLWEGSKAEKEGIKIGDVITSLNDINTASITNEQYCELLNENSNKDLLKITIKDAANNEKSVMLNKYDLVK